MGPERSASPRGALRAPAAILVFLLGLAAMQVAASLPRLGLGLRPTLMVSEALLVAPALAALALGGFSLARGLGLSAPPGGRVVGLSVAAGAALWGASLGLFEVQDLVWAPPEWYLDSFRRLHALLKPAGPWDALVSVASIAIAPAVCEEILFRGVVLPSLARSFGGWAGALGSAALFGAIHVDTYAGSHGADWSAYRIPFAFAMGLAFAAIRLRTGSLAPTMVAHAALNTITFLAAPLVDDPSEALHPEPVLGTFLLVVGTAAFLWLFRRFPIDLSGRQTVHSPA